MNLRCIIKGCLLVGVISLLSGCSTPEPGDVAMLPVNPIDTGGVNMSSAGSSQFKINKEQTQKLTAPDSSDDIRPMGVYPKGHPKNPLSPFGPLQQQDNSQPVAPGNSVIHAGY
jgi:hypothetical protein